MGNSKSHKAFQGEGHSLRSDNGGASNSGATIKSTQQQQTKPSSTRASASRTRLGRPVKHKPVPKTAEEHAAQRAQQQAAAEKRTQAWDERLARQREKRDKDQRAADAQIGRSISGGGTAANSERESLAGIDQDGAVSKEMQAQAKELERSGFNPYESTMHSAAAGRTAANLQGLQGPSEDSASVASADSTPSPEKIMQQAGQALEAAINAADLTQLERAIHFARNAVSSGSVDSDKVDPDVISKYEQAVALYDALVESVKQTEEVPDASEGTSKSTLSSTPQASEDHDFLLQTAAASLTEAMGELESAATLDREATLKTLRSLIKVVDNAKQKPEEAKFRKLRLANPAIRNMFVDFAAGAPLGVLKAVGFQESQETAANGESEERVLVLPSSHNGVFEARYEPTRSVLSELLAQFENA